MSDKDLELIEDAEVERKIMHMIILAPGVFLKKMTPINIDAEERSIKASKVHPIEIDVGGQIGNVGI